MTRGGKREGAGRSTMFKDKLKKITIKVSAEQHEKLKKVVGGYNAMIRKLLEGL